MLGNRITEQMPDEESADSAKKNLTLIDFLAEVARPPRPKIPRLTGRIDGVISFTDRYIKG